MRRALQLDGLRGIAILMVFLYHCFRVPLLWSGVDLFFVMSGYLITGILLRSKEQTTAPGGPARTAYWLPFYLRRARRILPPYFLFLAIVGFFFAIPWPRVWYWYVFFGANVDIARNGLALLPLVPLWSLAVEEQFYLIWPLVVRICDIGTLKTIAIGVIAAAPILRALCTPLFQSHWPIYTLPLFRADTLAWGSLIAASEYLAPSWTASRRRIAARAALIAGSILVLLSTFHSFRHGANLVPFNALGYTLVGVVCAAAVTYVLGSQNGFVHWILTRRSLRYLGKISYTFYLYHLAVLLLVQRYIPGGLGGIAAFLIAVAIASISWVMLESPLLSKPLRKPPGKERVSDRPSARARSAGAGSS